ncbi:MAG: hypothetical protein ACJ75H_23070 [Thermoanaerobaculia bacterium]
MSMNLSLAQILSSLASRIAHHREQEAFHAEREGFHRDQRADHAAELARLEPHFAALQATTPVAEDLAAHAGAATPPPPLPDELPANRKPSINAAVRRVVEAIPPDERFGPRAVTAEVNRRFAAKLGRPVEVSHVSVSLRWLADTGRIFLVERGRQKKESKYSRRRAEGK